MKHHKSIIVIAFAIGLFGCPGDKEFEAPPSQIEPVLPPQNAGVQSTSWEADIDVSRLPKVIERVFKQLDINLKQQDKKQGRYIFTGLSPSGFEVTVEAISIVKDLSFIRVSVGGRQEDIIITKLLQQNISNTLDMAIRKQNQ
jgi:hypothetical protein